MFGYVIFILSPLFHVRFCDNLMKRKQMIRIKFVYIVFSKH